jgi:hypothetical protein
VDERSGGQTHNKPAALIIDILLQGCLTQTLGKVGASTLRTNLIVRHGVTDNFYKAAKFIRIFDVVEETLDLPLFYQWLEVSESVFQFPDNPCLSDSTLSPWKVKSPFQFLPPRSFLDIAFRNGCAE